MMFSLLFSTQVLYVPRHWWHYVESVDPVTVSVNSWIELVSLRHYRTPALAPSRCPSHLEFVKLQRGRIKETLQGFFLVPFSLMALSNEKKAP